MQVLKDDSAEASGTMFDLLTAMARTPMGFLAMTVSKSNIVPDASAETSMTRSVLQQGGGDDRPQTEKEKGMTGHGRGASADRLWQCCSCSCRSSRCST